MTCAASEDSDQPGHPPSQGCRMGPWLPIERLAKTLISLADAQADLASSLGAHVILFVLS